MPFVCLDRCCVHFSSEYNDGEFAEVMTIGIEGIEEGFLLETIQINCCDTEQRTCWGRLKQE